MSIRGFHIIFITIATLLCLGVATWTLVLSNMKEDAFKYILGGGSAFAALALVVYGAYFYQKIKKLDI